MKFEYQQLIEEQVSIQKLEIQSFEMNVYLVKIYIKNELGEECSGMLYQRGDLMRFHSSQNIRDAFESVTVDQAVMLHESPYDEMIGNPPKARESLAIPFSLNQPY